MLEINRRLYSLLSKEWFFYLTIGIFIASALWVATTSLYPMAFDEDFHMGLIKIYASSWLPYGIEQTRDMATYGAATADASYLFHYIMSMPYRLFTSIGLSETTTIVLLRFINIAMITTALWLYRKVLFTAGISRPVTHTVLAVFMLIPILPVMAGQVNYDNLLLIIVSLATLLLIRITNFVRRHHEMPAADTWYFLGVVLIGMPIKYAYLPIALAMLLWLGFVTVRYTKKQPVRASIGHFVNATHQLGRGVKIGIIILFASGLFFSAHYAVNYAKYNSPIPACDVVFDEEACKAYGPWNRNFNLKNSLSESFEPVSLPLYIAEYWIPGMYQRLTFAVAGPTNLYQTKPPFVMTVLIFAAITIVAIICFMLSARKILQKNQFTWLALLITFIYLLPLVWKLYQAYVMTGEAVAVNGRYLLPLLPLIGAVMGISIMSVIDKYSIKRYAAIIISLGLVLLIIAGGGVSTYILLGEQHWFWPGWGQTSHSILQTIIKPITIAWSF